MFSLFILQLTLMNMVVFVVIRPDLFGAPELRGMLETSLGSNSSRLAMMMGLFMGLVLIYWVKYHRIVATTLLLVWTVACGIAMGVMSYYALSYGIIQVLIYSYCTLLLVSFLSQFQRHKLLCSKPLSGQGNGGSASVAPAPTNQDEPIEIESQTRSPEPPLRDL